ncbi:MAG TPA: hypothetical protein VGE72_13415, partial [Azospirillum sp.]
PGSPAGAMSRETLERVLSRMGEDPAPVAARPASPARPAPAGEGVNHEKSMMAIAKAFAAKKMG